MRRVSNPFQNAPQNHAHFDCPQANGEPGERAADSFDSQAVKTILRGLETI